MGWLGATLQERGLMIVDYPPSASERLAFIQGLMALLPASARPDLTFSTQRHEKIMTRARMVFAGRGITTGRWVIDWAARAAPGDEVYSQSYVKRLLELWDGDVPALLRAIDQMDAFAVTHTERSLQSSLAVAAERHDLDTRIQAGERLPPEALKTVLRDVPPKGDLKRTYAEQLMRYALQTRDADAALIVARLMDADPQLDQALQERLSRELELNPDVVYAFLRARVAAEQNEPWTLRLRAAALASLRVAILDGDAETLVNWLKLIAREPASYELGEVLHNGILASLDRARTDPELARALLVLAIRRDPPALEVMLADQSLIDSLPNALGKALRAYEGDPLALLQNYGAEVFLVALARAAEAKRGNLFTPSALEQVWTFYTGAASAIVPPAYTAERIVTLLVDQQPVWLSAGTLETLIMLLLRERRDELFFKLPPQLSAEKDFLRLLIGGMNRSGRGAAEFMPMVTQLIASDSLTPQNAVDLYIGLLDGSEWSRADLPVMSQLARALQQNPGVTVSTDVLWHLAHAAADAKDEQIGRVAARRLTADFESIEDDE